MGRAERGQPNALAVSTSGSILATCLLGSVRLAFDGRPLRLSNRKAQAVIAYLVLTEAAEERRSRLAGLLWSESEPRNALSSLRKTLLDLRRAFGQVGCDLLETTWTHVRLDSRRLQVDCIGLIEAVQKGDVPDQLVSEPYLPETLLAGFEDLDGEFAEWLSYQRNALRRQLSQHLLDRARDRASPAAQQRRSAQALLMLDPTNEEACRIVMRCAAEAGESATALRAYNELYRVLEIDHDTEPSLETQDLVARIKLGEFESAESDDTILVPGEPPRVAVLPFRTIGPDLVLTHHADGLVADIVHKLAAMRELLVISTNSTRSLRNCDVELSEIGRMLNARYIISGILRSVGARLRVSVELAEAASGAVLWQHSHDTDEHGLFELYDVIVANVVHQLAPNLHQAELRRMRRLQPENFGAYQLLLQARELIFALDPASFDQAGELLRQAITLDPAYPILHVTLSDWYGFRLGQGWSPEPKEDAQELDSAARRALRLDPGNAQAMAMLGHYRTILDRDYAEALAFFERAEDAAPSDATVLTMSSPTFAFIGRPDEAIRRAERARSLAPNDPFSFRVNHFLSIGHFLAGACDEAERWGRESLRACPNYAPNLLMLTCTLVEQGKLDEARELAARAMDVHPGFRVDAVAAKYASHDERQRRLYRANLLAAGMPA